MERGRDIARVIGPESSGSSPTVRVGITTLDVLRDLGPLESPDGNLRVIPKHGVDTAGSHVKGSTSTSFEVGEGTAGIVAARAQALSRDRGSEETLVHCAVQAPVPGSNVGVRLADTIGASMESVLVERVIVDEFKDIDLQEEL